jgi:anaerobic selenocysteine-containing dehydrogenase
VAAPLGYAGSSRMIQSHLHTCVLCEAACGIVVDTDDGKPVAVRGDPDDPFSQGHVCPKVVGLLDLHRDEERLRHPVVRRDGTWHEVGWEEAFARAADGLRAVRQQHGRDAVAGYQGNPTAHNLGLMTWGQVLFRRVLNTKNLYSASSADQNPQMLAALGMFGSPLAIPVPDLDRTDLLVVIGANPLVSNGSLMTAPDVRGRLRAIRARGGRVVVIDPRRTETAKLADEHIFVRPGADAALLAALFSVLVEERLLDCGSVTPHVVGLERLAEGVRELTPERTEPYTGVPAAVVRRLARELAATPRAAIYGRVGVCHQRFGTLANHLISAASIATGHLDREGGVMFSTPAYELGPLLRFLGMNGYDRFRSRVRGLPELIGELPVATLADEIETPGRGQVRGLLVSAGNPVLSAPNGVRLERAFEGLDFMVAIDGYINETTRFADVILPPVGALQRSHYDIALLGFAVRDVAKYTPGIGPRAEGERHDWEIAAELCVRLGTGSRSLRALGRAVARHVPPERLLDLGLRRGPHGAGLLGLRRKGLTLARLRAQPHGVDIGPLRPRVPEVLRTPDRRINLAPALVLDELSTLAEHVRRPAPTGLVLVGRRQLRSNNSWMHQSPQLIKGKPRCTLLVHPQDAEALGLNDGDEVEVRSRVGQVRVAVERTDAIMPGVVSLPHGFGHHRPDTRTSVASAHAGVSINDLTDDRLLDGPSGNAAFSGVPVELIPVRDEAAMHPTNRPASPS